MAVETYWTTVELPGVGPISVLVRDFRGHQGDRVMKRTILDGSYSDGTELSSADRRRAVELLPPIR